MSEAIIDARHGRFRYLQNDIWIGQSLTTYGEFSEQETEFLTKLCLPQHTVVEIGAHIGTQTIPLAKHIGPQGRLIAFEPQPRLCALLQSNITESGLRNVDIRQDAVGDTTRSLYLPDLDYATPGNFGGVTLAAEGAGISVPQVRLDDVLDLEYLHLIKLDAEGMELEALKGAEGLIRHHRPLMSVENDRVDRSAALIEFLLGLDYRLMWSLPPLFNPHNFFGETKDIFPGIVSINMLCIPAERFSKEIGPEEITHPNDRPLRLSLDTQPNSAPRMVFVASQPSSGSTLLAKILGSSPEIGRLNENAEGQWLVQGLGDSGQRWNPNYPPQMDEMRTIWKEAMEGLDVPVLLEKSPPNQCRMRRLLSAFSDHPQTVLRLIRDPLAICASWRRRYPANVLQQMWSPAPSLLDEDTAGLLRRLGGICGERFEMLHDLEDISNLTIRYEDFVQDPRFWISKIFEAIPELGEPPKIDYSFVARNRNTDLVDALSLNERRAILDGLEPHKAAVAAFGYGSKL